MGPLSFVFVAAEARDCPGPTVFAPGEISLPDRSEYRMAFTSDGKTGFFHVDGAGDPPAQTIWIARLRHGRWTAEVAPFSGSFRDSDPFVAPGDDAVYFSSNRVISGAPRVDADLWVVRRDGKGGWGAPEHLGPVVNTDHEELYPSVTADGTLYWGSDAEGGRGGWDVYRSERTGDGYGPPENLGVINTELWEFNPWVSADERRLLFVGLRHPEGLGLGDVYLSERVDGVWTAPRNLGPGINTAGDDFHPTLGPRHQLVFVRQVWDPLTPSELYRVDARCVGL